MKWLIVALVVAGCSGGSMVTGSGGTVGTGGAEATGGETGTGGAPASSGGATVGTGGAGTGGQGTGGAGTGGATPRTIATQWAVQIQAPAWTCIGQMVLAVTDGDGIGSWNCAETSSGCLYRQIYVTPGPCLSFAGRAAARFNADNSVLMQLSTDATHAIGVTGTLGVDRVIGTAEFADGTAPFTAILTAAN